jgi:hypothetical protein
MIKLILVSSIPNAFVASQVKSAESVRSVCLMLRSDRTPFGSISSRIVYLHKNIINKKLQQQKETTTIYISQNLCHSGEQQQLPNGDLPPFHRPIPLLQYTVPLFLPIPIPT